MDVGSIVIILDNHEVHTPEQLVFKTVFLLRGQHQGTDDLPRINQHFLHFLATNNLEKEEAPWVNMQTNDLVYSSPSYLITLTYATYLLLEQYRDEHPEVAGHVTGSTFSKEDQDRFLANLTVRAKEMAEKQAQQQALILGEVIEMNDVTPVPTGWVVGPPLWARINHFQQELGGRYRFVFSVHKAH